MSIKQQHHCPICKKELKFIKRYPNYVCRDCAEKANDINGRKLLFGNIGISGGYEAYFDDTKEKYDNHICYINEIKCYADEARFGGIVIEIINSDLH
jgi:hypothetical protein